MNGQAFRLVYDAEGHLVSVTGTGYSAEFAYDGDGKRVKSVINGETILFVGSYYEVKNPGSGQEVTKYYYAGPQRVAMRRYTIPQSMSVEFILSDHLGSTAVTTDSTGEMISELRYTPCPLRFAPGMLREGEVRYAWHDASLTTTPAYSHSRWTYTGQYSYADDPSTLEVEDFGLLYFNARWVDPQLGHFVQADIIIPGAGSSQAWDRYAYSFNNPSRYSDPSGHIIRPCPFCSMPIIDLDVTYWSQTEKFIVYAIVNLAGYHFDPNNGVITPPTLDEGIMMFGPLGMMTGPLDDIARIGKNSMGGAAQNAGKWISRTESMSLDARVYQRFISRRTDDAVFMLNGYTFDGFDAGRAVLLDAKNIPENFINPSTGEFKAWLSKGPDAWLKQAHNQISASDGLKIEWCFDSQAGRDAMYKLFSKKDPDILNYIDLIYRPME